MTGGAQPPWPELAGAAKPGATSLGTGGLQMDLCMAAPNVYSSQPFLVSFVLPSQ
jgi:hypothetical protein